MMAITGAADINFTIPADTFNDVYRSDMTSESSSWDVTNLVAGTLRNLPGSVANISDCTYDIFMDRVWFVRNDTDDILVYDRALTYSGSPNLIRTIVLDSDMTDTEGLDGPWWNPSAEKIEYLIADETNGGYYNFFEEITEADITASNNLSPINIQELQNAANPIDNNSGNEGSGYDKYGEVIYALGEGAQTSTPRKVFKCIRPTIRTTDYTYLDAEYTVTEPWDPEVEDHMTLYGATGAAADLSSVAYHAPSQTLLWLSQTDNRLVQTDLTGTILGTVSLGSLFTQPEGVCFVGDDVIVCGEIDEYAIFVYTP